MAADENWSPLALFILICIVAFAYGYISNVLNRGDGDPRYK